MEETRKAQGHQNSSQTHAGETEETTAGNQRHAGARGVAGAREAGAWGLRKESRAGPQPFGEHPVGKGFS